MIYCSNCGHQLDDKDVYCDKCGTATANEPDINIETSLKDISFSEIEEDKKQTIKISVIMIILGLVLITVFMIFIEISDNKRVKNDNSRIESVKNSHFEFLPDITVGDLIYEYYGEDYWICISSTGQVEFFGDNKKDNSGISLQFSFTDKKGIVDVSDIKYHKENETAHDISKEEFEKYFLSLYDMLSDDNKIVTTTNNSYIKVTLTSENKKASTVTTTAKVTTTTAVKKQEIIKESKYYLSYLMLLNEVNASIKREYGNMLIPYYKYYLYDINHDGFYELLIHIGESEAIAKILIYSIDEENEDIFIELGEINGGHTILVEKDGNLYTDFCHQSYQTVKNIQMVNLNGVWSVTQETVFEQEKLPEYIDYGTAIKSYDISDKSAIETLCPKELLEDKPYVNAYVETYSFSGRDGSKIRLYLDGDFAGVSVQIHNQEYTSEVEFYSKEDSDDYIEMNFNPFAEPPSVIYVTPYSNSGVAGDIVTCDIPKTASGTIQTGGFSYSVDNAKGQINCHGGIVAGFTTDYVVNGGAVGKVRNSLGDKWHVTAKNVCTNYGITWYELWDSDDGDYYGWVDSNYIDFY